MKYIILKIRKLFCQHTELSSKNNESIRCDFCGKLMAEVAPHMFAKTLVTRKMTDEEWEYIKHKSNNT